MSRRQPPRLAIWMLVHLAYTRQNSALTGDLLEEFERGRSAAWFWRQALIAIAQGAARHAIVQRPYLQAIAAGLAIELPAAWLLWRLHLPPKAHGAGAVTAAVLLLLSFWILLPVGRRLMIGDLSANLRLIVCAAADAPQRRTAAAWISVETFSHYLACYCVCALFYRRLSLDELIAVQIEFAVIALIPMALPLTTAPIAAPAEASAPTLAAPEPPRREWPAADGSLALQLPGGRTMLLEPETSAKSAFLAGDEGLAAALFRNAVPLELVRRAIWLGSARNYLLILAHPEESRALDLAELASLIEEAATTCRVESVLHFPACKNRFRSLFHRSPRH